MAQMKECKNDEMAWEKNKLNKDTSVKELPIESLREEMTTSTLQGFFEKSPGSFIQWQKQCLLSLLSIS